MIRQVEFKKIDAKDSKQRLDKWLKRFFPSLSQGKIEKMCRKGELRLDGRRVSAGTRVEDGQLLRIPPFEVFNKKKQKPQIFSDADNLMIKKSVVMRDEHMIVINKPAGIAVQGGSGQNNRHIDALSEMLVHEASERPRLLHRLDKETSGLLVLALSRKFAELFSKMLLHKQVRKVYWALVAGSPKRSEGFVNYPLIQKKDNYGVKKMLCISPDETLPPDAKQAISEYKLIEKLSRRVSWLSLSPITGRTHQLRAHMARIGCPIIGDTKYGQKKQANEGEGWGVIIDGLKTDKLFLHSRSLNFKHPITNRNIFLEADTPKHMEEAWKMFGWDLETVPKDPFKSIE